MKLKTSRSMLWLALGCATAASLGTTLAWAQSTVASASSGAQDQDQDMGGFGNPATFAVANGEELWNQPRGPKHVSLAKTCDLGMGPGVVKGAYAHMPRYFADTGRVQDMESRLLTCMVKGQGLDKAAIVKNLKGGPGGSLSDMASIAAYVADASKGMPIQVSIELPQEKQAYELGKKIFYYRAGPYDFSCSTCHSENGKRVRLAQVPNLSVPGPGAQESYAKWPAYRTSKGAVVTYEMRLMSCFKQTRTPKLEYGSPAAIDLTMFLARNAEGGKMDAPGLTR